ncbi:hypothetical protein ACFVH0_31825 [Streptomyces sp. NPDC127117]|uniref:hypothetical protein n=1 Tax=Streptomyces sp. NPDC127117 TaxID=3345368 RepID=UPI00363301CD
MKDAEQAHDDERHDPIRPDGPTGPAEPTGTAAEDDPDWFDDVPDENVGAVLSLDELAPHPGI